MLLFRIGQTNYSERSTEAERRPMSMATLRLAKDCLAEQIATRLSTPANNPPTQFPNKIRPFRPSVRRRSRLAYALLSGSEDVNNGVKCRVEGLSCETVLLRPAGLASAPLRSSLPVGYYRRAPGRRRGAAGALAPVFTRADNFCACAWAAGVQN